MCIEPFDNPLRDGRDCRVGFSQVQLEQSRITHQPYRGVLIRVFGIAARTALTLGLFNRFGIVGFGFGFGFGFEGEGGNNRFGIGIDFNRCFDPYGPREKVQSLTVGDADSNKMRCGP